MKKIMLAAFFAVITIVSVSAQNFGVKAGVDFATAKAKFEGLTVSENETGFYIGIFTNIEISDSFSIRPEVNYVSIEELDQIRVPVLAAINVADSFTLLAGPSLGFLLDSDDEINSFNFGIDLGAAYDITDNFLIEARYNLGVSNLVDMDGMDASLKLSGFQVGVGYKF